MLTKALTLAAISTTVLSAEFFSPNHFGAMMKRQGGYYPGTHLCGQGDTCAEACGPTEITCPSDPGTGLYCYDPVAGDHCCSDGSGNSCSSGYYCTTDGAGSTYCCPEGSDTADCAAAYSLTVSLASISFAPIPTSPSSGSPASAPVTTTSGVVHVSLPVASGTGTLGSYNATQLPTFSKTASPSQYTGAAAAKVVGGGMAVLAGAAGFAGLL